jgi:hypothetical protein
MESNPLFADTVYAPTRLGSAGASHLVGSRAGAVGAAILSLALVIGLTTAKDYGFTVDEFNTDDYGPKALAWYTSGFTDRSHLETVEQFLWYYGPWLQILTAIVQALDLAHPLTVRHAMNFGAGLAGLVALIPMARLTFGGWAGPVAILLCLTTGYFYGSLFFTPIDVPFMAAMTWATLGILAMTIRTVPTWSASITAGIFCGLAMATRPGGIITHAYLIGAMSLCALEAVARHGRTAGRPLAQIALRTVGTLALAWITAIVLWPWLQIGNPFAQFWTAYTHFLGLPMEFTFPHWGEQLTTNALPWYYVPEQLLARLPDGFLILLAVGSLLAIAAVVAFARASLVRFHNRGIAGLKGPVLTLARARGPLLLIVAASFPIMFLMIQRPTLYDGVRHILFVVPMLAILAAGAFLRLLSLLRRFPVIAAAVIIVAVLHLGATTVTLAKLHPLQYVAMNSLAGGTAGAAGRFELDYWGAAATTALRQLEHRLDSDRSGRFASEPPRVFGCIIHRGAAMGKLFQRNWHVEVDVNKADFIIETERWRCAKGSGARLIDEVRRLDTPLAWIYGNNRGLTY